VKHRPRVSWKDPSGGNRLERIEADLEADLSIAGSSGFHQALELGLIGPARLPDGLPTLLQGRADVIPRSALSAGGLHRLSLDGFEVLLKVGDRLQDLNGICVGAGSKRFPPFPRSATGHTFMVGCRGTLVKIN
jgi:hypothetical protein